MVFSAMTVPPFSKFLLNCRKFACHDCQHSYSYKSRNKDEKKAANC